jgi:hypothetical protein
MSAFWIPKPQEGKHYRFRNQEFFAVEGMVVLEDANDGSIKGLTVRTALKRAEALNAQVKVMNYRDERDEVMRCVENLIECIKEAKLQGDPTDPEICLKKVREQRRSRPVGFHQGLELNGRPDRRYRIPTYFVMHSPNYEKLKI